MSKLSLKLRVYLIIFYLGGAAFLILGLGSSKPPPLEALLIFLVLASIAESFPVLLQTNALVSVGFAIWFAAILVLGPAYAALVGFASAWNYYEFFVAKRPLYKILFNACNFALSTGIAGLVYVAFGGGIGPIKGAQFPGVILPLSMAGIVFYLVDNFTVALVISIENKRSIISLWRQNFLWLIPNYAMLSIVGVVLAQVYYVTGPVGIVLVVVPLVVARQTFQVYMKLKEAYLETVHSLVQALEAKDTYTRGHSERVAEYAEKIAREMKFSEDVVEMVRYAALLHDVGKIGISRKILNKPERLSISEYELVQKHPKIGAQIISEIAFLHEPLSAVLYHHEHLDGSGYAYGLSGEEIPIMARILTVADSFDAMTSARPYRDAMSVEEACQELIRCSGSQFDDPTVQAFLTAIEYTEFSEELEKEGEPVGVEQE